MNSVSTVTKRSARRRAQRLSSSSVLEIRAGGGNSARVIFGMNWLLHAPGGDRKAARKMPRDIARVDITRAGGFVCRAFSIGIRQMHAYRTHTCGALRASDAGQPARLSGWIHSKRDHGGLLFVDLRDHYGLTQCVFAAGSDAFAVVDGLRVESVITVTGKVVVREGNTVNPRLPTGEIELQAAEVAVQSAADVLPMQVAGDEKYPDEIRLKYRFI